MISFEITGELELFQRSARGFAQSILAPAARRAEQAQSAPPEIRALFAELGLGALALPEAVGGLGQGLLAQAIVEEELAAGDLGLTLAMPTPGAFGAFLLALGNAAQQARYLRPLIEANGRGAVAWVDLAPRVGTFSAVAVEEADGSFLLNGRKTEVLLGDQADAMIVFSRLERRSGAVHLGAFVVEAAAGRRPEGLRFGAPIDGLAFDAARPVSVEFDDLRLGPESRLAAADDRFDEAVLGVLGRLAVVGAARAVGLARAAFEHARNYAAERQAFGKPVAHFQAIAFLVADLATRVEVMRGLTQRAAFAYDQGETDALARAAMAGAEGHEGAIWVCNQAVQILGGAGFVRDYPVEKWMREAKAHMVYALPHPVADLLIGGLALGGAPTLAEDGPLPDLQAVWL